MYPHTLSAAGCVTEAFVLGAVGGSYVEYFVGATVPNEGVIDLWFGVRESCKFARVEYDIKGFVGYENNAVGGEACGV